MQAITQFAYFFYTFFCKWHLKNIFGPYLMEENGINKLITKNGQNYWKETNLTLLLV